jgi:hypothetical protein
MSAYEPLSILIACIAAIVSLVVWNGQRKLQREANDLQRATAELAKRQLQMLLREERGKNAARLSLSLERDAKGFRFRLTNISDVDAHDVGLDLLLKRPGDNPLIPSDYQAKFPLKRLRPGESVSLLAALHFGRPTAYNALLKWTNPDGSIAEEETFAAL